jgi:hypothetical protein
LADSCERMNQDVKKQHKRRHRPGLWESIMIMHAQKKEKELTQNANSLRLLASPTGFEPVLPA